jgi:chemotaxis protein methyltransferase CheR
MARLMRGIEVLTTEANESDAQGAALLDAVHARYGYDFRRYAAGSLARRLTLATRQAGLTSLDQLRDLVISDAEAFARLLATLTIHVTELFRDPAFYAAFRRDVVPYIRTFPTLKLWVAGCSTGEEAYSLAILLHEEGLHERARIYATDLSPRALARARDGIYPVEALRAASAAYLQAGGRDSLTRYFTVAYGHAAVVPAIARHIHFAEHDLASDEVFGEMNVVSCRNVLIYFARELKDRAVGVMRRSLVRGGFLCLGAKESLVLTGHAHGFDELAPGSRIYRARLEAGPA